MRMKVEARSCAWAKVMVPCTLDGYDARERTNVAVTLRRVLLLGVRGAQEPTNPLLVLATTVMDMLLLLLLLLLVVGAEEVVLPLMRKGFIGALDPCNGKSVSVLTDVAAVASVLAIPAMGTSPNLDERSPTVHPDCS